MQLYKTHNLMKFIFLVCYPLTEKGLLRKDEEQQDTFEL